MKDARITKPKKNLSWRSIKDWCFLGGLEQWTIEIPGRSAVMVMMRMMMLMCDLAMLT